MPEPYGIAPSSRHWLHDGRRWADTPGRGDIVTVQDVGHYLDRVETARPMLRKPANAKRPKAA